ncbi:MAG: coenzyme F420-0:L-glutamate ligase [bacterium]
MKVTPIKTRPIKSNRQDIFQILNKAIAKLPAKSILVVTSKIIAIAQGRVVQDDKDKLIKQEADFYLPRTKSKYNTSLTIKDSSLLPAAGIDASNSKGGFVLWPDQPQKAANQIRAYLTKRFKKKNIGVIITDSTTRPLRWGTTGVSIAHSGFKALKDYRKTKDLFGYKMQLTQANILDGLSAAAVVVMGEGRERTPLAIITELPFVTFQKRNPTQAELKQLKIDIKDDLYLPLLKNAKWKKGKGGIII